MQPALNKEKFNSAGFYNVETRDRNRTYNLESVEPPVTLAVKKTFQHLCKQVRAFSSVPLPADTTTMRAFS